MLYNKEYPATHSMSTAWFFVDQDDNVAIFDFDDNGPIPKEAFRTENGVTDLCFSDSVEEKDGVSQLPFSDEQVLDMLDGLWRTEVEDDYYWCDDIFQVNKDKLPEFFEYLKAPRKKVKEKWDNSFNPICLSKDLGIYKVGLDSYDYGEGLKNPYAKYLFDNEIVSRYCRCPYYDGDLDEWLSEKKTIELDAHDVHRNCPYYIYVGDYDARMPHEMVSSPKHPMKLSQMPAHLQGKVSRLNLKFSESPIIQVSHECRCQSRVEADRMCNVGILYTEDRFEYIEVKMPSGDFQFVLNYFDPTDGPTTPDYLPLVPSPEYIEKLKQLAVNKKFVSVKDCYYD